ncbi:mevalonate kinase-like isoform X3 [Salvia splendens]|uniref:mevalonate kinase-like isoform X3 n=1 Tax=Salvia splendens TaxID=180675 RepID=UPI001C27AA98|nr:mevalonate kinase-like isoform X3 [Salvia splendens]XP_042054090.1 mevalonate kinase-like isoform X3 [Salvia splendens]XP_042054091.1 mevalonate kinase-like isoform X3 [Salvia splendens]XP_042054092.1 mevalonate kinase-like isoform X3 [Salvia splendens]
MYHHHGIQALDDNEDALKLQLKDVDLEFSWPVGKLKAVLPELGIKSASSPSSCSLETSKAIASLVEELNLADAKLGLASGISAFLWLYTSIHGDKPAKVAVTSELPLGSGLGSSAALCVALSAALLSLSDSSKLDFSHQGWQTFGESELDLVNKWAFEGEKMIHGRPSGIDNTVSTFGNIVKFRSGELTHIKTNMPLKMLVTNTKVGRNTKALVAGVSERAARHGSAMTSVFKAVDSISNEVVGIIQSPVSDDLAITEEEEKLGELMEMNQGLLQCMGVSHSTIETVIKTTLKYKLATKLTGAGGGGCVLTLLPTRILFACAILFHCLISYIVHNLYVLYHPEFLFFFSYFCLMSSKYLK